MDKRHAAADTVPYNTGLWKHVKGAGKTGIPDTLVNAGILSHSCLHTNDGAWDGTVDTGRHETAPVSPPCGQMMNYRLQSG